MWEWGLEAEVESLGCALPRLDDIGVVGDELSAECEGSSLSESSSEAASRKDSAHACRAGAVIRVVR